MSETKARRMSAVPIILKSARRRMGEASLLAISTTFTVMILTIFVAAADSPRFNSVLSSIDTARRLLRVSGASVIFFVALSGWFYGEHYLKRRKRELASWLLLGMERRDAVIAISAEFAAASLAAMAVGILLGAAFSKFFSYLLAALMGDRSPIDMPFGLSSIVAAAIACAAQWLLSTARAAYDLARASLSSLMKAEKSADLPGEEERGRARALTVTGTALVLVGYAGATFSKKLAGPLLMPVLVVVVTGTFLVFAFLVPSLIDAFRRRRARQDASALIAAAQLSFRTRRNSRLLAFTAILVAMAGSAIGSVLALRIEDDGMSRRICPHDLELVSSSPEAVAQVEGILARHGVSDTAGKRSELESIRCMLEMENGATEIDAISISDWNRGALSLSEGPATSVPGAIRLFTGQRRAVESGDAKLGVRGAPSGSGMRVSIVPDPGLPPLSVKSIGLVAVLDEESYAALRSRSNPAAIRSHAAWDDLPADALRDAGSELERSFAGAVINRPVMLDAQGGLYGVMLFIGAFLAAVFFLAATSLIAFRSIEDGRDDGDRYREMVRLGALRSTIRKALLFQDLFTFGLPLLVGLCHATFALIMMRNITGYSNIVPTIVVASCLVITMALAILLTLERQEATIRSLVKMD
jgi:Predicted ABC-type transport system involved in lysophospholipase L1 biosynthesis, permease component